MKLSLGKLLKSFDERLETDVLDHFCNHLEVSAKQNEKHYLDNLNSLDKSEYEDEGEYEGVRAYLDDQLFFVDQMKTLGYELCIVALYKQVEIHIKRVVKRNFPSIDAKKLFNISSMKSALLFNIEMIPNFSAFDELRLLNNSIKHEGTISGELATTYPSWVEGAEFSDLDKAYERLSPLVQNYVKEFVGFAYNNSQKYTI